MKEKTEHPVPVLALEVWLGPMEGLRRVEPLFSDPCILRIGRARIDHKRGVPNDLVLAEADKISGVHAEIRFSGGVLYLKDLNSMNGTYVNGRRVSGEVTIRTGDVVLISTTPVQAVLGEEDPARADVVPAEQELDRVPFLEKTLGALRTLARKRGDDGADTRHLADVLLRSSDPTIESSLKAGNLTVDAGLGELWGGGLYRANAKWLSQIQAPAEPHKPPSGDPHLSPRVRRILHGVAQTLSALPAREAESRAPGALLQALLLSPGPVGTWLTEHRVAVRQPPQPAEREADSHRPTIRTLPVSATVRLEREEVPKGPAEPDEVIKPPVEREQVAKRSVEPEVVTKPPVERGEVTRPPVREAVAKPPVEPEAVAKPPKPPSPVPVLVPQPYTTGDVVLDQRARAIALQLEEACTLYRFSTAEDRRAALKQVVQREIAAVAPENRARILEQIRLQFPVIGAVAPEVPTEVPRLQQRIEELERRVRESKPRALEKAVVPAPREGSWQPAFAQGPLDPAAPAELRVLHEIVDFASKMEMFLLGLIQSVTMPGNVTGTFRLPSHRNTLGSVLSAIRQGKSFDADKVPDYLREIERWQVAILAAYHESTRVWFDKLWKKASPAAIEASTARSATWKMRGDAGDWWNRYKEVVKGLSPDVVQDQVLQTAYRLALDEFEKLKGRGQ